MNETHWFQVSISCWKLENISINVHKPPLDVLNMQWNPVNNHPAITTAITRSQTFPYVNALPFVSPTRPPCCKTANQAPRNTTTYSICTITLEKKTGNLSAAICSVIFNLFHGATHFATQFNLTTPFREFPFSHMKRSSVCKNRK